MAILAEKKEVCYPRKKECFVYPATLFPIKSDRKIFVDIGPGRGDFLFHLAKKHSEALIIGIEIKPNRVIKIIKNIEKKELNNLLIIEADAFLMLDRILEKSSVNEIYVSFPDPWPKRKHSKNRILKKEFIKKCENALIEGGKLVITTDVEDYAKSASKEIDHKNLKPEFSEIIKKNTYDIFPTFFYDKWKKIGRDAYIQVYIKK